MKCKYCSSKDVIKYGKRKSDLRGEVQIYFCKDCKRRFVKGNMTLGMRHRRFFIRRALKLRKKGMTLSQIAEDIGGITRQGIFYWIKKFSKPKT